MQAETAVSFETLKDKFDKFPTTVTFDVVFQNGIVFGHIVENINYAEKYKRKNPNKYVYSIVGEKDNRICQLKEGFLKQKDVIGYLFCDTQIPEQKIFL